eukprot:3933942-Rhodomonas_salina.1
MECHRRAAAMQLTRGPGACRFRERAGGTEFGFSSASRDKAQAIGYALPAAGTEQGRGSVQTVQCPRFPQLGAVMRGQERAEAGLEIVTGMVDRGVDLSWLSYFPEEKEVMACFLDASGAARSPDASDASCSASAVRVPDSSSCATDPAPAAVQPGTVRLSALRGGSADTRRRGGHARGGLGGGRGRRGGQAAAGEAAGHGAAGAGQCQPAREYAGGAAGAAEEAAPGGVQEHNRRAADRVSRDSIARSGSDSEVHRVQAGRDRRVSRVLRRARRRKCGRV